MELEEIRENRMKTINDICNQFGVTKQRVSQLIAADKFLPRPRKLMKYYVFSDSVVLLRTATGRPSKSKKKK